MQKISIKGHLEAIVLKLLHEQGQMYGYEITQKVKAITNGTIEITEGALYPLLHRLESEGIISVHLTEEDNRLRKNYRLTEQGHQKRHSAVTELRHFIDALHLLAQPLKTKPSEIK